ncbi:MAG: ABC transporter ATP-binding protein [Hyphomicrobiales bacterium]
MTEIETRRLSIAYGGAAVLRDLDLKVESGEFLVLLGPSGCGKSTLLNAIAGLLEISEGQVWIGGRNVTWMEPKERGIAMVFQSYALYPMMDVYGNLAFSLKVAGLKSQEIDSRVRRAAEMLELTPLLRRRPSALSGGQRQRVAIGRALVREVDVFLFDEPLSNLDAQLRAELRVEIKELHRRLGNTTIYVTHDQIEALTLADRIAVMRSGVIQQLDDPDAVYNRPSNAFVAGFVGSPAMNFISGELHDDGGAPALRAAGTLIPLPGYDGASGRDQGRPVTLGIRPEHIAVGEAAAAQDFRWPAGVQLRESLGSEVLLWSTLANTRIAIRASAELKVREGETVPAGFSSARLSLFDRETGQRI